jgi:hypothetical protein
VNTVLEDSFFRALDLLWLRLLASQHSRKCVFFPGTAGLLQSARSLGCFSHDPRSDLADVLFLALALVIAEFLL